MLGPSFQTQKPLYINSPSFSSSSNQSNYTTSRSLSFSTSLSQDAFSKGCLSLNTIQRPICHFVVCEATANKRAYSAAKRSRQAEKRRIYNKARKSEIKIRMKKKPHFLLIWPEI